MNKKTIITNIKPQKKNGDVLKSITDVINSKDNDPKYKYIKQKPNNKKQDITPPKTKYFKPASIENSEFLLNVAKTYNVKLCSSIAK